MQQRCWKELQAWQLPHANKVSQQIRHNVLSCSNSWSRCTDFLVWKECGCYFTSVFHVNCLLWLKLQEFPFGQRDRIWVHHSPVLSTWYIYKPLSSILNFQIKSGSHLIKCNPPSYNQKHANSLSKRGFKVPVCSFLLWVISLLIDCGMKSMTSVLPWGWRAARTLRFNCEGTLQTLPGTEESKIQVPGRR